MKQRIVVQVAEKLERLIITPKRLKIAVGGRSGQKSIAFADSFLKFCDDGQRLCCAREFQSSIDVSVHALLKERTRVLMPDQYNRTLHSTAKKIYSDAGGEIFYKGLNRDPDSIRSMFGVNKIWIEEGRSLSEETIETLLPTIREGGSEIWISMNRGKSTDPVSRYFLKPYDKYLKRDKFYEDDDIMIVWINYDDNPFHPEVLEKQRLRDKLILPPARYAHIWDGEYEDTVEGAIIPPEWFDACKDAHLVLGFEPTGLEVVSFDPADVGVDEKALVHRHGSIIKDVRYWQSGDINTAADIALDYAIEHKVDDFIWDGDGMGTGLRRQIGDALLGKKIRSTMFKGQLTAAQPDKIYEPMDSELGKARSNKETFFNQRAQHYWMLRDRMFKTYLAVTQKRWSNPDELISFSSTIEHIDQLRAEICTIPKKNNGTGRFQVLSKPEMRKPPYNLDSPGGSDCVMMSLATRGLLHKSTDNIRYNEHQVYDSSVGY